AVLFRQRLLRPSTNPRPSCYVIKSTRRGGANRHSYGGDDERTAATTTASRQAYRHEPARDRRVPAQRDDLSGRNRQRARSARHTAVVSLARRRDLVVLHYGQSALEGPRCRSAYRGTGGCGYRVSGTTRRRGHRQGGTGGRGAAGGRAGLPVDRGGTIVRPQEPR